MKVFEWINADTPPEKPKIVDMRYGLGCMNDLTIVMADLFKESMIALGEPNCNKMNNPSKMIEEMDKATLGRLWGEFRKNYKGELVSKKKVEKAIFERNYFIHSYHNNNPTKEDGKRLFDLIKLLTKVNNQLTNVSDSIGKMKKKETNIRNDDVHKIMIKTILSCKRFETDNVLLSETDNVLLSEIGNNLNKQGIRFNRKLSEVIQDFGWNVYIYEGYETSPFVKICEIR